jgi:hypothetical protein
VETHRVIRERLVPDQGTMLRAAHRARAVLAFDAADSTLPKELADTFSVANVLALLREEGKPVSVSFRAHGGEHAAVTCAVEDALRLHEAGMTLYFKPANAFLEGACRELAEILGEDVDHAQPAIFLSRKGASTPLHFDAGDGVTLQIVGRKRWSTTERPHISFPPRNYFPGAAWHEDLAVLDGRVPSLSDVGPLKDSVLEPGTCLFVPGGVWHEVECLDDSVSIDLNVTPNTSRWYDAFGQVVRAILMRDSVARKHASVSEHGCTDEAVAEGEHVLDHLRTELERLRVGDLLGERREPMGGGPWRWNPAAVLRTSRTEGGVSVEVEIRGFYEKAGSFVLPPGVAGRVSQLLELRILSESAVKELFSDTPKLDVMSLLRALYDLQAIQTV